MPPPSPNDAPTRRPMAPSRQFPARINHIPKDLFLRPELFEEELQKIFYADEWIMVAHAAEIPEPGDFKTFAVGHVPLIISRDLEGTVRVFFNSCSHRATQLETAARGKRKSFECPYHRWSFSMKGELVATPAKPGDFPDYFRNEDFHLKSPKLAMVHGLIFVSLGNPPPIEEYLAGWTDQIAEVMGGDGDLILLGYQKVEFKANWKTFTDNDVYHAPLLHTAFRMLNWQGGKGVQQTDARGHRGYVSELSLPKSTAMLKDPSIIEHHGTADLKRASVNVRFFPMAGLTRHLDAINIRFANSTAVDSTEVHYAFFARRDDSPELFRQRVRQSSNLLGPCGMVSMEDAAIFHRVHIGSGAPGNAIFVKGVRDEFVVPMDDYSQNDESTNLPFWERYRQAMGFEREPA